MQNSSPKNKKKTPNSKENSIKAQQEVEVKKDFTKKEISHNRTKHSSSRIFWALFLIFTGLILILNNFGILSWNIWATLWRLWPLFLILPGLQLILGHSWISNAIITIIGTLIIGFVLILAVGNENQDFNNWLEDNIPWINTNLNISNQSKSKTITVNDSDFDNITERDLTMDLGTGDFTISDSNNDYYFKSNSNYYEGIEAPKLEKSKSNNILDLKFSTESEPFSSWSFNNTISGIKHKVDLGMPELETSLNIDLAAGKVVTDFKQLNVSRMSLDVAAGSIESKFSSSSIPSDLLIVNVSAGKASITLPKDTGVIIEHNTGVGTIKIDGRTITSDGIYTSEGYDDSKDKLEIKIDVGAGSCQIDFD